MVFIFLEKVYDRVPREVMWWILEKYIKLIKDIYDRAITSVRTSGGIISTFPITIGLHKGSTLCPYLFALVMDELTKSIQEEVLWCMLFADDIVLMDEIRHGVNVKLEIW